LSKALQNYRFYLKRQNHSLTFLNFTGHLLAKRARRNAQTQNCNTLPRKNTSNSPFPTQEKLLEKPLYLISETICRVHFNMKKQVFWDIFFGSSNNCHYNTAFIGQKTYLCVNLKLI